MILTPPPTDGSFYSTTRNKEAQAAATRLRREVATLLDEAVRLGLVSEEAAGAEQSQVAGELTQSPAS